jgi:hypothetical protein
MAQVQINGATQIQLGSVADDRLTDRYIKANGSRVFTANQSLNGFRLTDLADPVSAQDAATRQYVNDTLLGTFGTSTAVGRSVLSATSKAAARAAIDAENSTAKGQPNGFAALDATGKVPVAQIPAAGALQLTKADVGLGNVDNTSDATKWSATVALSNKTLDTTNTVTLRADRFTLWDTNDSTRRARFSAATVTPNTTQIYVLPGNSTTLAGTDSIQIITNKTISGDLNTFSQIPQDAVSGLVSALQARELVTRKGQANGYVPLNSAGKIEAGYLPSFVDDVVEYATKTSFPSVGEVGKIYVALDTQAIYRWTGSVYVLLGGDPDMVPGSYATTIGNGTTTTFVLNHNFQTLDVLVGVWETATGREVNCDKARTTQNTVTLTFAAAPGVNAHRVVILNGGVVADKTLASLVPNWSTSTLSSAGTLSADPNYTYIVLLAAGAAPTLPSAVGNSSRYILKNTHTADRTVATTVAQTVEGLPSLVLSPGASAEVVSDGANWRII